MPNKEIHFMASAITSVLAYGYFKREQGQELNGWELLGVGVCGGFVGILPDIIEPALDPNHRRTAHSFTAGAGLMLTNNELNQTQLLTQNQKDFAKAMLVGYGTHLVLDITTPKGLPLIYKGG